MLEEERRQKEKVKHRLDLIRQMKGERRCYGEYIANIDERDRKYAPIVLQPLVICYFEYLATHIARSSVLRNVKV